ncbi:T9SS type A sorting domain-containing protein [Aequorivita echinoideorum]|uniref:T9SS type A sorting domain-containing protein n=1 Tax=Aequorivita echinoideorum TaxID=1549647 RepID=A0ABS5S0X2_9FLAO|nr:T9SS type A sorting domain-containing protein [Aequorivita echinoideorum]MBT0606856.1 T9SS type A sorting domain-containing protein [Aequorivita echinoideorum]
MSAASFAQVAGTSFEEPAVFSGQYTDTGDANVAHDLVNNTDQPLVNFVSIGGELGFSASYTPYDTPDVGLTDGDFVGVTNFTPSADVMFTDGEQGYQISDVDGNYILEFDIVDLSGVANPTISLDYLMSINTNNPANGNYEGDGTLNESGFDRLRIYVRDLTNNTEIDIFNSTGSDLDDFVPFDTASGEYQVEWLSGTADLTTNTNVQLVVEARTNASAETFFLDNIVFGGILGVNGQSSNQFAIYPNPSTNGFVNIVSKVSGAKAVAVYDVLGKEVINTTINGDRLDVSKLNSGIYIVKIAQGKTTTTQKLIVK